MNKPLVTEKIRAAIKELATAYGESKLTEISDALIDLVKLLHEIEQDL